MWVLRYWLNVVNREVINSWEDMSTAKTRTLSTYALIFFLLPFFAFLRIAPTAVNISGIMLFAYVLGIISVLLEHRSLKRF